jgi:hypothetical protein
VASKTYQNKKEFMDVVIVPFNARISSPLVPQMRGLYTDGIWSLFDSVEFNDFWARVAPTP